ncbi:hypothetical protein GLOIN_2v1772065 [Rhizophagus irregularis DAOM 181602=DAOM 197198]|nr:hypothetical protein GLOIN_2v1772065 [Rhizophagus irregularis DAOM 181602=DAOM 197198]
MPEYTKRQHMISRRDQKMSRRRRGLQHMISTRDKLLTECQPRNLKWEEFIKDCIKATNTSDIHSDEYNKDLRQEVVVVRNSKNSTSIGRNCDEKDDPFRLVVPKEIIRRSTTKKRSLLKSERK